MNKLMAEMRYNKASNSYENGKAEIARAIQRAKLSILAAEHQLELGSIPVANLEQAQKCIGLAVHESERLAIYEEAMKFYGEVAIA